MNTSNYEDVLRIIPVIPMSEEEIDFDIMDCQPQGLDVSIVNDAELSQKSVVEVGENSHLTFFTLADENYPFLVLHVKNINMFFVITVVFEDSSGRERIIEMTNKRSTIQVDGDFCKLPIDIEIGWQHICLDMELILNKAFGTSYRQCLEVSMSGSCRFSKIFFQAKRYADAQLPKFLRVAENEFK
jgi:hypothetical protein